MRVFVILKIMCLLTYVRLCVTVVGAKPVSDLVVPGRYASTIKRSSTRYGNKCYVFSVMVLITVNYY